MNVMLGLILISILTVMSECEENVCQNNGTCMKHVLTVTCICEPGYVGAFCQEKGLVPYTFSTPAL